MGGGDIPVHRTDPGHSDPEPERTGTEWGAGRVTGVPEALVAGLGGRQGSRERAKALQREEVQGLWRQARDFTNWQEYFNNNVRADDEKFFFNFFHYYWITQFLFLPIFPKIFH